MQDSQSVLEVHVFKMFIVFNLINAKKFFKVCLTILLYIEPFHCSNNDFFFQIVVFPCLICTANCSFSLNRTTRVLIVS